MRLFVLTSLIVGLLLSVDGMARVNLNTATEQELSHELKNIGKEKAAAIVEYRKIHGNFKSIEDLKKVKGIGESTFQINRHRLSTSNKKKAAKGGANAEKQEKSRKHKK